MKIERDQIHVWHIDLNISSDAIDASKNYLSLDELSRADTLSNTAVQRRFIARRALLRIILAKYLSKPVLEIAFSYTPQRKLYLGNNPLNLTFNLSHCEDECLVAISLGYNVGIDIERTGRIKNYLSVVSLSLSQYEQDEILNYPKHEQEAAFIRVWTRKEAYTKAIGDGLLYAFPLFSISSDAFSPQLIEDKNNKNNELTWSLHNIEVMKPYCACVCVDSNEIKLTHYSFEDKIT